MKITYRSLRLLLLICSVLISLIIIGTQRTPTADAVCTLDCWAIITSPNQGNYENVLYAVAAVGLSDVWSVGSFQEQFGEIKTLAVHWDGTSWSLNLPNNPNPYTANVLYGVTAPGSSNVWAVGYYQNTSGQIRTLAEKWNGSSWNTSTSANQGTGANYLKGVAAVDANTGWAVGHYVNSSGVAKTLTQRTTDGGSTWTIVSSPNEGTGDNYLLSVTKVPSGGGDMWAVGYFINSSGVAQPLSMKWSQSQSTWTSYTPEVQGSGANYFRGVEAISGSSVWAVGDYVNTSSVSRTLAEQWNGMKWNTSLPQNSSATEDNYLNAVALLGSSDRIWAVGYSRTTSGVLKTLAEFYYAGWNLTSPENAGTLANVFNGVEEISGGAGGVGIATTWAVGYSQNTSSVKRTLIERYVQSAPSREP